MQIKHHVVLVGLMAVGKSSIGRKMSKQVGVSFVDIDHDIEKCEGKPITEIFAQKGEEYFRQLEHETLKKYLENEEPHIIASGGGLFVSEANRKLIKQSAISVWIQVDIDILVERCGRKTTRPLLLTGDPKETLEGLKEKRYPLYQEADIHVHGDEGPISQLVSRIIELVKEESQ